MLDLTQVVRYFTGLVCKWRVSKSAPVVFPILKTHLSKKTPKIQIFWDFFFELKLVLDNMLQNKL